MANNENYITEEQAVKKWKVRDKHGHVKKSGSLAVVGSVNIEVDSTGGDQPTADSTYQNGQLGITFHDIKGERGNGITSINVEEIQEDGGDNIVHIHCTDDNTEEGTQFRVKNGRRGNGIASVTEEASSEDGGINTHTFTDTDGNTHVIHTRNGSQGRPGVDRQPVESGDVMISQSLGDSETIVMSQKGVTENLNYIKNEAFGFVIEGTLEINKYYNNSGIKQNGNGYCCTIPFFPVVQGGVLSMNEENSLGYGFVGIILYDSSKTRIGNQPLSGKVTSITAEYVANINPNAAYFRVNIFKTGSSTALTSEDVADFNVSFKNTSMKDDIESVRQEVGGMVSDVADLQNGLKGMTDDVFGFSIVPSLTLNKYLNNSGATQSSNGWAVTSHIDVIEGATISMNKNNALGYRFYGLLFYGSAKNFLGSYNIGTSLKWEITYEEIKGHYADAAFVRINVWKGSTSPALTQESVADFNIILKNESLIDNVNRLDGELQEVKDVLGDMSKSGTLHFDSANGATSYIKSSLNGTVAQLNFVARESSSFSSNSCFNFKSFSLNGTSVHADPDEVSSVMVEGVYMGANHGNSGLRIITCNGHGKTYEDIGSQWVRGSSGIIFTIMMIVDENHIALLGENTQIYPKFSFEPVLTTTYTHFSGAVHTDNIVVSAYTSSQLKPSYSDKAMTIYVDGKAVDESGDYDFDELKICEYYDVYNPASVLAAVQAGVGTFTENPNFAELSGLDKMFRLSNVYTFKSADMCIVNATLTLYQDVDISQWCFLIQMLLGGSNAKLYIPKVLPMTINSTPYDFRTIADYSSMSEAYITSAYWENPLLPPDRYVQYTDSVGFSGGLLFDYGVGGERRASCIDKAFMLYSSRKMYPFAVTDVVGSKEGDSYTAIAFRRYFKRSNLNQNGVICCNTFEYNNKFYIYADYNAAGFYEIDIPAKFLGKKIEIHEKSDNVALLTEVSSMKMLVKVTMGNDDVYGYIVAQIK